MLIYEKPKNILEIINHKIKITFQHIIKKNGIIIIYKNEKTIKLQELIYLLGRILNL